jgi:hypothetical protein
MNYADAKLEARIGGVLETAGQSFSPTDICYFCFHGLIKGQS